MDSTDDHKVPAQDCCPTTRGQWSAPALARPKGLYLCVLLSSEGGSGPGLKGQVWPTIQHNSQGQLCKLQDGKW